MADQPQPSPGYVGMLGLTCFCMLVGIVAMALEANDYDWDPKPKATPAIALPKVVAAATPDFPVESTVAEAKPSAKPAEVAKVEPAKTAPTVVLPAIPAPVLPAETAKVEAPKPTGPIPSPLTIPLKSGPATPTAAPKEEPKPEAPKPSGPTPSPLRIGR